MSLLFRFKTMDDLLKKTVTPIFPRAGLVVIHTETLLAFKPGIIPKHYLLACLQTGYNTETPLACLLSNQV